MKEELISYQTIKLLKEKEFDCKKYLSLDSDNPKNLTSNYNPAKYQPWYYKITQSLLQRWLREVHNIDVFPVACFIGEPKYKYSYYILKANDDLDTDGCETETYEEALEQGLQEALTFINI